MISDEDALLNSKCPKTLELRWQTEVSSSIYATPLIADINRYKKILEFILIINYYFFFHFGAMNFLMGIAKFKDVCLRG